MNFKEYLTETMQERKIAYSMKSLSDYVKKIKEKRKKKLVKINGIK